MRLICVLLCYICFCSCKKEASIKPREFSKVEIETLMQDSLLNVRALEVNKEEEGVFASSHGKLGVIVKELDYKVKEEKSAYPIYTESLKYDSIIPHFRSIAFTKNGVFALSIAHPALLYKVEEKDSVQLVYKEERENVFYDSMDFWNDQEGIAIGDSVDGCLSVIITRDGGNSWNKLPCDDLPMGVENEGAFAASDTNIAIVGDLTWVATTAGRIYYSADKGRAWGVFDTPIVKEKETEGIYSVDFYDELNGFAIGGDYTKPDNKDANKIRTKDGGKTWELVAKGKEPGYRSCVQYIPNRKAKELVTVGFNGVDYSNDSGSTWKHLSDEGFYTIRFLNDSVAYAAGKGRISKLTFK